LKNEIQALEQSKLTTSTPIAVFNHHGNDGLQIANQQGGVINLNVNTSVSNNVVFDVTIKVDTSSYNLFVIDDEAYNDSYFLIPKECALTTSVGVDYEISAQYASLSSVAIEKIKTFPSVFASKNRINSRTEPDHPAYYGFVTKIVIQEIDIKIFFQKFYSMPQLRLIEIAPALKIKCASLRNEFDQIHWAIKEVDLASELRMAGINIPVESVASIADSNKT
jgi:hypothetical protein